MRTEEQPVPVAGAQDMRVLQTCGFALPTDKTLNAYLGISLSKTRFFSHDTTARYVRWCCDRFGRLLVIIADSLEAYNYQVFKKGLTIEAARARTLRSGQQRQIGYRSAVPPELESRVEVVLTSELLREPRCMAMLELVTAARAKGVAFRSALRATILQAVGGRVHEAGFGAEELEDALDTLEFYLLEEIAVILYVSCVADPAYHVSVFPYPPPEILRHLYDGAYGADFAALTGGRPYAALTLVPAEYADVA
jgi:tRNA-dependent cyclodipeptide synthase